MSWFCGVGNAGEAGIVAKVHLPVLAMDEEVGY
jgi:hypothetical protein